MAVVKSGNSISVKLYLKILSYSLIIFIAQPLWALFKGIVSRGPDGQAYRQVKGIGLSRLYLTN